MTFAQCSPQAQSPAETAAAVRSALLQPGDRRWKEFLGRVPADFYHLPEYLEVAARYEGGEPFGFYAEGGSTECLIPLLQRPLPPILEAPPEWCDWISPYGYPSPLLAPPHGGPQATEIVRAVCREAKERGVVSLFLRMNPVLPFPLEILSTCGRLVHHGKTVFIDLSRPLPEIEAGIRENHRRGIRKLVRAGFRVEFNNWDFLDDFIRMYTQTMARVQASPFYFFSADYFRGLRAALGDSLSLVTVLSPEGEAAAAGLFVATSGLLEYHLGGTGDNYLKLAPSKLMFDSVWRRAREEGFRLLHLGGGLGGRTDSLFLFKQGFSPLEASFYTFRAVIDEDKYGLLTGRWRQLSGREAAEPDFFPVYRHL